MKKKKETQYVGAGELYRPGFSLCFHREGMGVQRFNGLGSGSAKVTKRWHAYLYDQTSRDSKRQGQLSQFWYPPNFKVYTP